MAITIRDATTDDAAAIGALTLALVERWIAADCSEDGLRHLRAWMSPRMHGERLRAGDVCCVAERADELLGVAAIRPPRHLYLLFVADTHQRLGLARRLWDAARARAFVREGIGPVTVNASRPAIDAYRRLGFVTVGEECSEHGFPFTPMSWQPGA